MDGGSKQIDGVEDGPENGGLKSGPCLIAGFHALSCTSPSYYNPYRGVNKNTLSVDMVRLSLTFKGDRGEWLSRKGAQLTDCDEMSAWTSKIRPGGWYELWSFALGGSSVALGIGFMEPSCKVNMHKGFIEFNPNKVAGDKRFHGLLKTLGTCVSKARLKRFDLAYDIPVSRYDCRLSKDRRMYKSVDIDKVRCAVDKAVVEPAKDEAARIVAAAREEAAALLNDAEARKAELVTEIADKEGDLAELDSQLEDVKLDIEDEQDRLECLRQRADGVARDIGELQPIATEVRGWEAAGKAERGAILDNIVVKCDGLARRIRAGVAGMRIKVEELRSRISRPLEYLMRREQPRQQSLNDVLRDAQRAADAWNRDHAAPQRTYRGRAR